MKLITSLIGACVMSICFQTNAQDEVFSPNGSIDFTQIFYGNAGKYKTSEVHPSIAFNYNFLPKWSLGVNWDRSWNLYDYKGLENQQNNRYSIPLVTLNYNNGNIENTQVNWSSSLMLKYQNSFSQDSQTYAMAQTSFDLSSYLPSSEYIKATQFALTPLYIYGWNSEGSTAHSNTVGLSFLSNWELPANFSVTLNAYAFREWYAGSFVLQNEDQTYKNANYFMILAYLNYNKTIYEFNDKTQLKFNFIGGMDPWIASNKKAAWSPFLLSNEMYEWVGPTVTEGNYKNTYNLFTLPQLNLSYQLDKSLSVSLFAQAKYSNQVWGSTEKDWRVQPQGGFSLSYQF
ncbi:hypothetical protein B9T31_02700 [Acinetobacter sp. ANC 4558]|uniref:FomA family porin-like outer membrane protein n=1 Tax=Acinetobacter sp. ANC 4558 TaxID=1977876 RepID=UPI000A32C2B1|nr:hypothetical protein [Acinetobacter sp. ANC 4558]OTG87431.1 hypothetical protein B9T31_02700 [Acinetobacter sp. ANC 4558]